MEYKLIRSKRKTIGLYVKPEGLIVRAPLNATKKDIDKVIEKHKKWITAHIGKIQEQKYKSTETLGYEEIKELADKAAIVIPERVDFYAKKIGVTYGRITIRNQRTIWGSCSSKGNLNFNCLLMLAPKEVLDSVVVHELCHIKHMNHSKEFYKEVLKAFPQYYECDQWLKENGKMLLFMKKK